jgi:hypothetical protein
MSREEEEVTNFPSADRRPGQAQEKPDPKQIDDIERRKREQIEEPQKRNLD